MCFLRYASLIGSRQFDGSNSISGWLAARCGNASMKPRWMSACPKMASTASGPCARHAFESMMISLYHVY